MHRHLFKIANIQLKKNIIKMAHKIIDTQNNHKITKQAR